MDEVNYESFSNNLGIFAILKTHWIRSIGLLDEVIFFGILVFYNE